MPTSSTKLPIISVIMLTYNRETLVTRAINSILRQTFKDFEFIIVDNGSTDCSGEIADEYAKTDNRIKVIHREHGNIGSGRNAGIDAANGTYIAFIDDDDWAMPDFLEFLHALAKNNRADISICGSWRQYENGILEPKYIFDDIFLHVAEAAVTEVILRKYYNSATPTKLFTKSLFDDIRFPVAGKYDDISTTYKLFAQSRLTAVQGEGKYYFSRHDTNNSSVATNHQLLGQHQLEEYLSAFRERTSYLSQALPSLIDFAKWSEWSYMISMVEKIRKHDISGCDEPLKYMLCELTQHRNAFVSAPWTREFERDWVKEFLPKRKGQHCD